jgi:very-short-patch-repair endonuclease
MHDRELAIAELAGRQDNLVSRDQLRAIGLGRGAIAHRLSAGRWQRVHPSVYLVAPAPLDLGARARAAVLACGEGAVVSHTTAAGLWGILAGDDAIHVTVPCRNTGPREGVQVHRTSTLHREDTAIRGGLLLTSPARTICDVAAIAPVREAEAALNEARVQRLVTDRQLHAVIERAPTLKGTAAVRTLLRADVETGYTRSRAERAMVELTRAAGLPCPLLNQRLLGYLVDFLWPQHHLVLEVDGYKYHRHRAAFERDRRRDQVFVSSGYRALRITWRQLCHEQLFVVARVAQAMALAI